MGTTLYYLVCLKEGTIRETLLYNQPKSLCLFKKKEVQSQYKAYKLKIVSQIQYQYLIKGGVLS